MRFEYIAGIVASLLIILFVSIVVHRKRPKRLKKPHYTAKWRELQAYCADKSTWPEALKSADMLLDQALRRRRYKGKSMGERMVAAQKVLTDNDAVWVAHNLSKKIVENPKLRLKEKEVKDALIGFRQALKDLGAL